MGPMLADNGFHIDFAHRPFAWSSEASGKAAVHVVIVGFSNGLPPIKRKIYDYGSPKAEPTLRLTENLNIYLVDSPLVGISKHTSPFISLPKLTEGNRPQDGGGLIIEHEQLQEILITEPWLGDFIRPLVGGHDMLNGEKRFCFWLVSISPSQIRSSSVLRNRLEVVAASRRESKTVKAREKAATPSLFFAIRQPSQKWLGVPRHSSENRAIIPMAFFPSTSIAHDSLLAADGAAVWVFSILQTRIWTTWVKVVGGRLESRIRVTPDVSYNAFPWPDMTDQLKSTLDMAGQAVLDAREQFPDQRLADLYDPMTTPKPLLDAHKALDALVFKAYGIKPSATDAEILEALFRRYVDLCTEPTLDI